METEEEFEQLFVHLDYKKDGKIDLEEWNTAFNIKCKKQINSLHSSF